jgi:hypothetical protein
MLSFVLGVYVRLIHHHHHHHQLLMSPPLGHRPSLWNIMRTGHNPPRELSADWWGQTA